MTLWQVFPGSADVLKELSTKWNVSVASTRIPSIAFAQLEVALGPAESKEDGLGLGILPLFCSASPPKDYPDLATIDRELTEVMRSVAALAYEGNKAAR